MITTAELQASGLSRNAIRARVQWGWLYPIHRGVYAVGHPNLGREGCFMAAVKACGSGAVLSHYAALAQFELVKWDGRAIDVTVPREGGRRHRGIRVRRSLGLPSIDVGHAAGIPITSPARTLVDTASVLPAAATVRLGPRRGSTKLAEILATGPAPTRSDLEDLVLDLILAGGLPHPDVNVPLTLDGRTVIPDFRWPDRRLVVEADSATWHDNQLAREDDAERQSLLEANGERVIRVTWDAAVSRPRQTLDRLRLAFGR